MALYLLNIDGASKHYFSASLTVTDLQRAST